MKYEIGVLSEKQNIESSSISYQPLGKITIDKDGAKILLPKGYYLVGPKIKTDPDVQIIIIQKPGKTFINK